jgi:glycosyltransferase involved in cell wall biosynthesis
VMVLNPWSVVAAIPPPGLEGKGWQAGICRLSIHQAPRGDHRRTVIASAIESTAQIPAPEYGVKARRRADDVRPAAHSMTSVVIPVKNDSAALRRCLAALSVQTRRADEVIVVDNGSSDDSVSVAQAWGAIVIREPEPGIPAAAATGYDAARFDVICRLDADTVPPRCWIENGVASLASHPNTAAVTGPGFFYDGPMWGSRLIAALYLGAYFGSIRLALGTTPLFGSSFFLRREAWRAVRGSVHMWGTSLHDDLDLTIHLTPAYRIRYDPDARVGISYRPFTQSHTFALRLRRGLLTFVLNWPRSSPTLRWRQIILRQHRRVSLRKWSRD